MSEREQVVTLTNPPFCYTVEWLAGLTAEQQQAFITSTRS